jgi:hypothetical protein
MKTRIPRKPRKHIRLPPPPFQTLTNGIRLALVNIRAFRQRVDVIMSRVCGRVRIRFYTRANRWSKIDVVDGALDWRQHCSLWRAVNSMRLWFFAHIASHYALADRPQLSAM